MSLLQQSQPLPLPTIPVPSLLSLPPPTTATPAPIQPMPPSLPPGTIITEGAERKDKGFRRLISYKKVNTHSPARSLTGDGRAPDVLGLGYHSGCGVRWHTRKSNGRKVLMWRYPPLSCRRRRSGTGSSLGRLQGECGWRGSVRVWCGGGVQID